MKPKKDIGIIHEEFVQEYLFKKPYSDYIISVTNYTLGEVKDGGIEFELRDNETLETECFLIGLRKKPPENLDLPKDCFEGYRVFYEILGEK